MVKKLLVFIMALGLALNASAQLTTIDPSDVQFWTGTGSNSTVVAIGWDDEDAPYTPTVVIWGVHWEGSIYLVNALDTIAAYDTRFSYVMGGSGFLTSLYYNDPDEGLVLTPSGGYNCNNYNGAYGSTTLNSTHLRITESTCSNYNFAGVTNIVYAVDPNAVTSCPKAQSVSISDLTAYSATVNITDTTNLNNYTVMLFEGDSLIDSVVIYTQTISYSTLTANNGYRVEVYSNCSDGTQTSARSASFRTPCVEVAHTLLIHREGVRLPQVMEQKGLLHVGESGVAPLQHLRSLYQQLFLGQCERRQMPLREQPSHKSDHLGATSI